MVKDTIKIKGAKIHNLKNIDVEIPKNKLVVICGLSGSGKSSLAFDTIYVEGQRRYLESLSSYARQFLGGLKKADVEKIENLSPTLAIDQRTIFSNPRSTVGTATEIYDYLRLLFARVGKPFCPNCNLEVVSVPAQKILERIFQFQNAKIIILGPVIHQQKGHHRPTIEEIIKQGFNKLRIDGNYYNAKEARLLHLARTKKHSIEVIAGEIEIPEIKELNGSLKEKQALKTRNQKIKKLLKEQKNDSLDFIKKALKIGNGIILCHVFEKNNKPREFTYSALFSCPKCGFSFGKIEPRLFSFNSPVGACPACHGLGTKMIIDPDLILNYELTLEEGAILPWHQLPRFTRYAIGVYNQKQNLRLSIQPHIWSIPLKKLSKEDLNIILYGGTYFEGIIPQMERVYLETKSDYIRYLSLIHI